MNVTLYGNADSGSTGLTIGYGDGNYADLSSAQISGVNTISTWAKWNDLSLPSQTLFDFYSTVTKPPVWGASYTAITTPVVFNQEQTSSSINVASISSNYTGAKPRTIEFTQVTNTASSNQQHLFGHRCEVFSQSFIFRIWTSGRLQFYGPQNINSQTLPNFWDGVTRRVAISYDGNVTLTFIVDNEYESFTLNQPLNTGPLVDGSNFYTAAIGGKPNGISWIGTLGPVNWYDNYITSFDQIPTRQNQWGQLGQDIDGEATLDYSGYSVSLSTDGTIIANGAYSGQVRVHQYSSAQDQWSQIGQDIDGVTTGNYTTTVSLSSDGSILAIGSHTSSSTDIGRVRIYQYNSGQNQWIQLGQNINDEAAGTRFGISVSLSSDGNVLAIGAHRSENSTGHVGIYKYTSGQWNKQGQDIDGEDTGDESGLSVSLSSDGNIVAIGAQFNSSKGHVRVYEYRGTSWIQIAQDIDGENNGDSFGKSVSLSSDGTRLGIGANRNSGGEYHSGHVRVYEIKKLIKGGDINIISTDA